jgi:hypothetical protein
MSEIYKNNNNEEEIVIYNGHHYEVEKRQNRVSIPGISMKFISSRKCSDRKCTHSIETLDYFPGGEVAGTRV